MTKKVLSYNNKGACTYGGEIVRRIEYICNKCKRRVDPSVVVKLSVATVEGKSPVSKSSLDFCPEDFKALQRKVADFCSNTEENEPESIHEKTEESSVSVTYHDDDEQSGEKQEAVTGGSSFEEEAADKKSGPIRLEERKRMFRLYLLDNLSVEEVAKKMGRTVKGVARSISCAKKSGELEKIKDELMSESFDFEEDSSQREEYIGSGVSNARIKHDSYTSMPHTKVMGGKKYDIGCILALAKAGWSVGKIAEEKNYDEEVVKEILISHNSPVNETKVQ